MDLDVVNDVVTDGLAVASSGACAQCLVSLGVGPEVAVTAAVIGSAVLNVGLRLWREYRARRQERGDAEAG